MKIHMRNALTAVIAMTSLAALSATADEGHADGATARPATGLVKEVRTGTWRFRDIAMAEKEGYGLLLGCASGHEHGAMGVHYVNSGLVDDPTLDPQRPEALMYETRDGQQYLVAAEFVVLAEAWDAANDAPPVLMGQLFNYTGSPNRYGLPPFYELHVWAWKHNPHGMFVDDNPEVSCEEYVAE
jgi:hypothetical protein